VSIFSPPVRRTIAIFDLDRTFVRIDTYPRFLIRVLLKRPRRWLPSLVLPLALGTHLAGLRDSTWLKETFLRIVCGGLTDAELADRVQAFVDDTASTKVRPGAADTLRMHVNSGHRAILVTASLDIYVPVLARRLGFDEVLCTKAARDERDRLTGKLGGPNCRGAAKIERVEELLGHDRSADHIVAYSDHHADLALLEWADAGFAINPTKRLRQQATSSSLVELDWDRPADTLHPAASAP
jgi:HAD superfamily hydrolase (TIGR01490 family)